MNPTATPTATATGATAGPAVPPADRPRFVGPNPRDPRLHLALVISTVQVLGQTVFDFDVSIAQILLAIGTGGALDLVVNRGRQGQWIWPASGMVSGNGIALILRVPGTEHGDWWSVRGGGYFVAASVVAIASKHLIRWRGRHVFNPSNLAIVAVAVGFNLLPGANRLDLQDLWWGPWSPGLAFCLLVLVVGGLTITRRVGMMGAALAYWVALALGTAAVASPDHCITARWHFGPLCGVDYWWILVSSPEVVIFLLFMITDPKTTPPGRLQRIGFGALTGAITAVAVWPQATELRVKIVVLASLLVTCAARFVLERWFPEPPPDPTRSSTLRLAGAGLAVMAVVGLTVAGRPAGPDTGGVVAALPELAPVVAPPAFVDESARSVRPPVDDDRAADLAAELVETLAVEALAVETGDLALLERTTGGPRLAALRGAVARGQDVVVPEIEAVTVAVERASPQASPELVLRAEVRGDGASIVRTYRLEPVGELGDLGDLGNGFRVVGPVPDLVAGP